MNMLKSLYKINFLIVVLLVILSACRNQSTKLHFTVINTLDIDRKSETISIPVSRITELGKKDDYENLQISDNDKILVTQLVDNDLDGNADEILFQSDFKANEEKNFTIELIKETKQLPSNNVTTYSRFVPERIDDYAWENDRVAFRTYGPKAQQITESGQPGGTLTSGVDCWLKRVSYPVIDAWYKKNLDSAGYYHVDHGEGYDPYHVGNSRGCGGVGVWDNDSLYISKNFTRYKTIATGPIRTIFELSYDSWKANGSIVNEKKTISLDLGSNLSRYEVAVVSDSPLSNITIGITLHDGKGEVKLDSAHGCFRYWESIDNTALGTGIVIDPATVLSAQEHRVNVKEQSHILVMTKPKENKVVYYAGFGWVKSKQFNSQKEWDEYLENFSKRISSPLLVKYN
ncbi:MAG TPA: DUF4861 domain-containing protein [Cyclobacteriaceae bacterium]|jgi:hypothetical protein|nr:DUF4861 domain-containing protein [Cyclobacteriaceae bacterium]